MTTQDPYERELSTMPQGPDSRRPSGMATPHARILLGLATEVLAGLAVNALWGGDHPGVVWLVHSVTDRHAVPARKLVLCRLWWWCCGNFSSLSFGWLFSYIVVIFRCAVKMNGKPLSIALGKKKGITQDEKMSVLC